MTGTFSGTGFLGSCTGGTTLHSAMAGTKYWYFALCNDLRFWVPVLSTGTLHFATTSEFGCQYWYQHFASHLACPTQADLTRLPTHAPLKLQPATQKYFRACFHVFSMRFQPRNVFIHVFMCSQCVLNPD